MPAFTLHPQLAADTLDLGTVTPNGLCRLLLMNDATYPWFILVPQINNIREICELTTKQRSQLWAESHTLSLALQTAFKPHKLNIAALGNMVPQLHIHHVARYTTDPAWPAPVWGRLPAVVYDEVVRKQVIAALQQALTAS